MAEIIFCQKQTRYESTKPFDRWARLIVYEDDVGDSFDSISPFQFLFKQSLIIGAKLMPVGISETGENFMEAEKDYKLHENAIKALLEREELEMKIDVILYTSVSRIKEAYYADYTTKMELKCEPDKKEITYWATCGEDNCGLLIAFEDLSIYKEGLEYLEEIWRK